jgi:preprotein translocase subunit SecE
MKKQSRKLILKICNTKKEVAMKKSLGIGLLVLVMSLVFAISAFGADKLIVKDASGTNDVFKVENTGALTISGTDTLNNFTLNVAGATGGARNVQISTGYGNSRMAFVVGDPTDQAPRFIALGSEDQSVNKGAAYFDYGSKLHDLPAATFNVRYLYTTGNQPMIFRRR